VNVIANEQGYRDALNAVIAAVTQVLTNKGLSPGPVHEHATLAGFGLDSLDLAEILILIELDFGIEIDTSSLKRMRQVKDLALIVRNSRSENS
jgi:acyl carrier protein